jgi:heme/copper-type cytochrome/quinol oxidase subunit 2
MRFRVIAMSEDEFDAWVEEQRQQAAADAADGAGERVGVAGAGE